MTPPEVNSESLMASYFLAQALSAVTASAWALTRAKLGGGVRRRSIFASAGSRTPWHRPISCCHLRTCSATTLSSVRRWVVQSVSWARTRAVPWGPNCPWEAASRMTANSRVSACGSQAAR